MSGSMSGSLASQIEDLFGATVSKQLLIKSVLAYGVFGAAQVLYRLLRGWRQCSRMREILEEIPFTKGPGHNEQGGFLKDMVANLSRRHDWRMEICAGQPLSKTLGFSWHPGMYTLFVNDPDITRHILKDEFRKYTKPSSELDAFFYYFEEFMGEGIFVVKHGVGSPDGGKEWSRMRKVTAQIFSRKIFSTLMQGVFAEKAQALRKFLQQSRDQGRQVDLQSCFLNFTFDSVMRIFFGEESSTTMGVPNKYGKAFDTAQTKLRKHAAKSLTSFMMFSTFLPWPFGGHHGGLARALRDLASPTWQEVKSAARVLDMEAERLVTKCQQDPNFQERRDLLAQFLQANFTTDFVKQMVLHLISAGRDTTASLLSWTFYELTKDVDIQKRLRNEIMQKVPPGTPLNMNNLSTNEMPYLHGVIYEALRLWPPVPINAKMAFEDDILPGGWKIPAFARVAYVPYSMGRDATRYPQPEVFRPERWIPFTAPAPHDFPVFQAGPRICLGMDMALLEAKIAVVELLQHCRFEMVPGQEITYGAKIIMDIQSNGRDEFMVHVEDW